MTMTTFQAILLTAIIAIWLVFSIVILIATIQNYLSKYVLAMMLTQ